MMPFGLRTCTQTRLHEYIAEVENNPEGWGTWKTQLPLLTQGVLLASKLNIAEPVNEQVAQQVVAQGFCLPFWVPLDVCILYPVCVFHPASRMPS